MSIDRTHCPNCHTLWVDAGKKPYLPVVGAKFNPCELLHGPGGTAGLYADLVFAFMDQKFPEWSHEGKFTQINGGGATWEAVVEDMEPPDQPEGGQLTERQVEWLARFDRDAEGL